MSGRTEAEIAHELYGGTEAVVGQYRPRIAESLNSLRDAKGLSGEETDKLAVETSKFFHDATIGSEPAQNLHGLLVKYINNPPTDEEVQEWTVTSRRRLREQYGEDADRRMEAANQYFKDHPTLAKQLTESGVGSHPEVILALAERADRLRRRS